MAPIRVHDAVDVEAALLADTLVPPPPPSNLAEGATFELRQAMARFSPPAVHPHRRAAVVEALALLDVFPFAAETLIRTNAILGGDAAQNEAFDVADRVGVVVPVEVLAGALGVPEAERAEVRRDVRTIVEVIGRQHRSSPDSDHAAFRLLDRFGGHTPAGVAAVSLLYQTLDATAALFTSHVLARHRNQLRRPALAATTRVATEATVIGSTAIPLGAAVIVDLDSSGFEFGAGSHGCPGRGVAERIVAGTLAAIDASGFELCVDDIEWQPDGRPKTLPMKKAAARP